VAAALTQEKVNLNALQAQATATADILRAHTLATANAVAATQSAAQAQAMANADALQAQAAATADILQAHALATANAAAATQSAVQTQEKLNADVLQAQAAATADMLQANTLATADAATATQSAVETEAKLEQSRRLQLTSGAATQSALATAAQQKMDQAVSGTATAVAAASFQAQSDVVQRQEPGVLLWMWITPIPLSSLRCYPFGVCRAGWLRGEAEVSRRPHAEPTDPDSRPVRGWLEEVEHHSPHGAEPDRGQAVWMWSNQSDSYR